MSIMPKGRLERNIDLPSGAVVHVVEGGDADGPPVLLLHGFPESWAAWSGVLDAASGARVLALDLPGIGGSSDAGCGGVKRAIAGVVREMVAELGLTDVTLVGHDAGGMVAYAYLRRYDDAHRVVIVETAIPGVDPWDTVANDPRLWHFRFHAVPELPETMADGRQGPYFDFFLDVMTADPSRIGSAARAAYVQAHASRAQLTAAFDLYRAFERDVADNDPAGLEPAATPLLYVRGDRSYADPGVYAQGFRDAGVRDVRTAVVPDAGHYLPDEQPAALWALLAEGLPQPAGQNS